MPFPDAKSLVRPLVQKLHAYVPGEQPAIPDLIKLNTNENPYPPAPGVQSALAGFDVSVLRTYPQPTADRLRDRLAMLHGVDRNHLIVTHGGDEALRLAMTTFVDPGGAFGMADPSYSLYPVLAEIQDARVVAVPLTTDWQLPADFAERLNAADARLTCVVNPHAPSGVLLDAAAIADLAGRLSGVLLVDEAYVDFVDPALGHDLAPLTREFDNLLLLRTFSKGYSLAGLRLGYLIGAPGLIDPLIGKTRDSYNVDAISQILGEAAIVERDHAAATWQRVREDRERLRHGLSQLGLDAPPSQSNFLLARVPASSRLDAAAIYAGLKGRGILVRYFAVPGLDDRLRITVGTTEQNQRLLDELQRLLGG
jgi:histidinol-phosphate aminotransferase